MQHQKERFVFRSISNVMHSNGLLKDTNYPQAVQFNHCTKITNMILFNTKLHVNIIRLNSIINLFYTQASQKIILCITYINTIHLTVSLAMQILFNFKCI